MYVTANQFYVFLACVSIGSTCGILYSIFYLIKYFVKINVIKILLDVLFYVASFFIFLMCGYKLYFPSLRVFMLLGFFIGLVVYIKSFNIILAKIVKKLYNKIKIKCKKVNTQDDGI